MADKDRNEKPHLLTAKVKAYGRYKGISWGIQCPYEPQDIRDCGVVEECTGSEADVAKYGCRPYPVEPKFPQGYTPGTELPEEFQQEWEAWEDEVTEWKDEHIDYGSGYGHRVGDCWFTHILGEGDVEPEEILENIPDGTLINGPFEVEVHFEGSYDETEPSFTLWKDTHDHAS